MKEYKKKKIQTDKEELFKFEKEVIHKDGTDRDSKDTKKKLS